MIHNVAFI